MKYLIYRWTLATYFCFVFILSLATAEGCNQLGFYLIYLTNWNVILNAVSTVFGAVLVTLYYRQKIMFDDDSKAMTKTIKFYWLLTTLSTVVSVTLSCVYWPLIYDGRDKGLNDALSHAGNAVMMIVDVYIRAHPPRYSHFVYPLSFGFFYGFLFSLPYTLLGGTERDLNNFIYSVVDWKKHPAAALTFALATIVFLIFMHFFLTFLATSRTYLHRRMMSKKLMNRSTTSAENNHGFDSS